MRKLLVVFLLAAAVDFAFAQKSETRAQPEPAIDQAHTKWIAEVIQTIHTIKPGMTRADLKKVFGEEGGISFTMHRRYVYKTCPYIKVEVDFAAADGLIEKSDDRITKISQPFLEFSIGD